MVSAAALTFHRTQYALQGFTIFLNAARPAFLRQMAAIVALAREEDLIKGDESPHAWKEVAIDPPLALPDMIAELSFADLLGSEPDRMAHWLNVYEPGEFIDAHADAGGDVQLMIPVEMPPPGEGGALWLGTMQRILPVAVGDVLLFAAHRLLHGTTAVQAGRRISFNGRIWLRHKTFELR
jgi:hypothetical protein